MSLSTPHGSDETKLKPIFILDESQLLNPHGSDETKGENYDRVFGSTS